MIEEHEQLTVSKIPLGITDPNLGVPEEVAAIDQVLVNRVRFYNFFFF